MKLKHIKFKLISNIIFTSMVIFSIGIILGSCNQKVSVTPPDSPPPNGYIFINSKPKGFNIYLDGKERRRQTPDSLTWLKTGTYQITLKRNYFRDTTFTADVVEGEKESTFINFLNNPLVYGTIFCSSNPDSAEIFINDSSTGLLTPSYIHRVIPGFYEIKYHIKNHLDDSIKVLVTSNLLTNATLTLIDTTIWREFNTQNSAIPSGNLTSIAVDNSNTIWMGSSDQGLISFDGSTWNDYLKPFTIYCIKINNAGEMWIGTSDGPAIDFGFIGKGSDFPDLNISAIDFDNTGFTWLGMKNGGLLKTYIAMHTRYFIVYNKEGGQLPENNVTAIAHTSDNTLWVGTLNAGVVSEIHNNWTTYTQLNSSLPSNNIGAITVAKDNTVWIGCNREALGSGSVTYFDGSTFNAIYLLPSCSSVYSLFIDAKGRIWAATNTGIYIIENYTQTTFFNTETTGLNLSNARGFAEDSNGKIWIATYGNGLIEYKGSQ